MERQRTALAILIAALILGIAGDALLRYVPWGVNALLWTALFLAGCWFAGLQRASALFPAACALMAATGLLWRDSEVLAALDILILVLFLPMLALEARGVRAWAAGLVEIGWAMATTAVQTVIGFPQVVAQDLRWDDVPRDGKRRGRTALRGLILAAPALVVFGVLLSAADAKFERLLSDLLFFEIDEMLAHIVISVVIAAICAGFLRSLLLSGPMPRFERPALLRLGAGEVNVALGLVNVLFALFVFVQFRYFFGAAPGALSEYARRGFFELVAVVTLVVPMLLVLEWLVDKSEGLKGFRVMAGTQIVLVFVMALSAWRRMQLYRDEFGLTRLRFFTTAFMIWVAVLLLWFVVTVLTGRRHRFAIGALSTAVVAVAILHVINPDAMIVETNVARAREGRRPFDAAYASMLSDDAAQAIFAHRAAFDWRALDSFAFRHRPMGWRTWNVSRARAIETIRRSGIKRHTTDRAAPARRVDPRVQQLPQVRHLQEQVPVTDTVDGDREEQQRQHAEEDARRRRGSGERRR